MKPATIWFLCIAAVIIGGLFGLGVREPATERAVGSDATRGLGAASEDKGMLAFRFLKESEFVPIFDEFGRAQPVADGENFAPSEKPLRSDTVSVNLDIDGSVEYKAIMDQGDALVYAWKARDGEVYFDFHAHPPDVNPDFFTRYKKGEGQSDQGSVLAAYAGQHGWYWLNLGDEPVTIDLQVTGFYDEILEISPY